MSVTNLVTNLSLCLVITKFGDKFVTEFVTKFVTKIVWGPIWHSLGILSIVVDMPKYAVWTNFPWFEGTQGRFLGPGWIGHSGQSGTAGRRPRVTGAL